MPDFDRARDELLSELDSLRREAAIVHDELVVPGWGTEDRHGFPCTLYGFVMTAMALLDRLSCFAAGRTEGQTPRMRELLVEMGASDESAAVAVQLWRHTLMHTGYPLQVIDRSTESRYKWLLHWAEQLPRPQHLTVSTLGDKERVLNMGVLYLIEDLATYARAIFERWAADSAQRETVARVHCKIARTQRF